MTLREFFQWLPTEGWWLQGRMIRRTCCHCPIEEVWCESRKEGIEHLGPADLDDGVWECAEMIGLYRSTAERIIQAADAVPGHDVKLRAKLMKHCGLSEPLNREGF